MISLTYIVEQLGLLLEFMVRVTAPIVAIAFSIHLFILLMNYTGEMISKAFAPPPEPPKPLSRAQFEERYGPIRDDLIEEAYEIRRRSKPIFAALGGFAIAVLVGLLWGVLTLLTSGPNAQWFGFVIALTIVGTVCMIVITVWDERRTGPARRAWQEKVRATYNIAPEDRITLKIARRA